jgi:hypothetical protein
MLVLASLVFVSCSGLSSLTPGMLDEAERKWNTSKPPAYHLVVVMQGDRVERGEFDVQVEENVVTSLKRNGVAVHSAAEQDYSIDGLFKIIRDEVELARNPTLLGAPSGYSAYLMARFDGKTGRLQHYRRSVGGASNSIDIEVLEFEAGPAN